jgi:hypothetical protein
MRRRHFNLSVESVEQRLSLSGLGAAAPVAAEVVTLDRGGDAPRDFLMRDDGPRDGGANGIIAILIG